MIPNRSGDILFIGDVVLSDPCSVDLPAAMPVVLNLECPITEAQGPAPGKVVLKSETDWLTPAFGKRLRVACLANNHIMDYGAEGLADTVALLEASGVEWFGAGTDRNTVRNGVVVDFGNHQVGFSGYVCPSTHPVFATSHTPGVLPLDLALIRADLDILRAKGAERVVVCLHWGAEEVPHPKPADVVLARSIAKMGADLIIGHHSHCIQPYEIHNHSPIFYGLGNAIMPDLNIPCDYNEFHQPGSQYVKRQRSWNRRSLAVDYSIKTQQVRVRRLHFDGQSLICRRSFVATSRLLRGVRSVQTSVFRCAAVYGQLRNLVAGFAERPRLPRLHHLRSLWGSPP